MEERTTDKVTYLAYSDGQARSIEKSIVREEAWTMFVNGQELVTLLCTPDKMRALALGFLAAEGIINRLDEVALLRVCEEEGNIIEVRLLDQGFCLPSRRVLLSGCGGGITFDALARSRQPLHSSLAISPSQVGGLISQLHRKAEAYKAAGGIHCSALSDGQELLVVAEDVGRHNTLDKIRGECMLRGIPTKDHLLLTTGRISSEMVNKAMGMEVPIVISRTSPTDMAVRLAHSWGITLIGYARGRKMNLYTHPQRVKSP